MMPPHDFQRERSTGARRAGLAEPDQRAPNPRQRQARRPGELVADGSHRGFAHVRRRPRGQQVVEEVQQQVLEGRPVLRQHPARGGGPGHERGEVLGVPAPGRGGHRPQFAG